MYHDGPALEMNSRRKYDPHQSRTEKINLNERVMADNDGWGLFGSGSQRSLPPSSEAMMDTLFGGSSREAPIVYGGFDERFDSYDERHREKGFDTLQSQLCPSELYDLVIVLHGPPGVGKTLATESISEYTEKPLYSINIGELSSEKKVSARLEVIFELASRWDAVLLMDEADFVLEKRSYENLERNGVVSMFLRMLEYYRGILFLTTNRLGTMDIAFQSRVALAIRYNLLTPALRHQIWLNFIERLSDSEKLAKQQLLERAGVGNQWKADSQYHHHGSIACLGREPYTWLAQV
ncbi:Fidgetin-like protein [Paramyrothecium foliicola]|nr:Fidgetin-like protein [Paramyrothecium foliicola]